MIMNKKDPTNEETKKEKLERWMKDVPLHKKRVVRPLAERVYSKIHSIPSAADILQLGMPFGEKCVLVEKLEILDALDVGTEEYFDLKKDIFRRINNYCEIKASNAKLEELYKNLNDAPTISNILASKAPTTEKMILFQKLEALHDNKPGTEEFYAIKRSIEQKLDSYRRMDEDERTIEDMDSKALALTAKLQDPLRMRILKSDVSERNRAVILEKLHQLNMLSTDDSSYGKLYEWIERAIKISDRIVPIEIGDSSGTYLLSVKQYMDRHLYGMQLPKERLLELLAMRITKTNSRDMSIGLVGPPGVGKCLHPDTQILMYLGGMKAAKNIVRGDILMGDDSQPRIVLSTTSGVDQMYKITPEYSEPFIVNEPHVLTLYNEFTEHTSDIPLNEYLEKSDTWRAKHKMFCVPVEYARANVKNDPYLVGILLNSQLTTVDDIIKEYLTNRLDNLSSYVNGIADIKMLNLSTIDKTEIAYLLNHRYIPDAYLYNSRENRYKLLKGFIEAVKPRISASESNSGQRRGKSAERTPDSAVSNKSNRSNSKTKRSSTPNYTRPASSKGRTKDGHVYTKTGSGRYLEHTPDEPESGKTPKSGRTPSSGKTKHTRTSSGKPVPKTVIKNKPGLTAFIQRTYSSADLDNELDRIPKVQSRVPRTKSPTESKARLSATTKADLLATAINTVKNTGSRQSRLDKFKAKLPAIGSKDTKLTVKDKILAEQIKVLARSIGFKVMQISDEIWICDDVDTLPPIDRKIETAFHVTKLVRSDYCGFTLDGNGRFVLSSFLVTHNTHLIKVFADAIKQPFIKINMGGNIDPHHFIGHSYTYDGSSPGVIVKSISELKDANGRGCKSGVMFLDEFDKIGIGSKVSQTFLHISDPLQQSDFQDQYMPEIKIDLSNLLFAYSMNDTKSVDPTLLNRLPVVDLGGYSFKEKAVILQNYILRESLENIGMLPSDVTFDEDAIAFIIHETESEDRKGIRKGKHIIQTAVNKINALKCAPTGLFSYSLPRFSLPIRITRGILEKIGAVPKKTEQVYTNMYL